MKKYLMLLLLLTPFLVSGLNTPEVTNVSNSSRLYRTSFYLNAGYAYTFRTYSNADTVVHILDSSNSQVAYNDDCGANCDGSQGSLNSTVTFTPSTSGYYYGILRHYSSGVIGAVATIKAYLGTTLIATQTDRPVGGYKIRTDSWAATQEYAPGDRTIRQFHNLYFYYFNRSKEENGGAEGNDTVMYLMSNYNTITDFNDDGGASWSAKLFKAPGASCSSGCYVLGGAYPSTDYSEGNARMIMDYHTTECDLDAWGVCYPDSYRFSDDYDNDEDGISDTLENIMGTSSTFFTGVDSDDDGLNDYLETYGIGSILLPWEGSDPTQKDVFVEVDYFGRTITGSMAYFYKDNASNIESNLQYSFLHHGDIRFHVDVDDYIGVMEDGGTKVFARCGSAPSPADPEAFYLSDEKSSYFTSSRTGIYYWVVAANRHTSDTTGSSGLSCGSTGSGLGTDKVIVSLGHYANDGTLTNYSGTVIHELGHAFMLTHNDNDLGGTSVINRSIMNYEYQLEGNLPANEAGDSPYRYSTDTSITRTDLDWSYNNIVPGTGENGCLNSQAEANSSPKQPCIDAQPNAQPTCDCTFEEWSLLELDSAGIMGFGAEPVETDSLASEEVENNSYYERPVFGLNGEIVARNMNELVKSGENYSKLTKKRDKEKYRVEKEKMMKSFYTKEKKENLKSDYIKLLKKKGFKEGQGYDIVDGNIVFR